MSKKTYRLIERVSQEEVLTQDEIKSSLIKWFSNVLDYGQQLNENNNKLFEKKPKELMVGDKK